MCQGQFTLAATHVGWNEYVYFLTPYAVDFTLYLKFVVAQLCF